MLPFLMIEVREHGSWYGRWFDNLNDPAAAKVSTALTRISLGNFSNVKSVGSGVSEYRVDFGPGYRIYFGKDGDRLVILLGGGSKKKQQADITRAIELWEQYKDEKKHQTKNQGK
jgi:putative addiction module killer protein